MSQEEEVIDFSNRLAAPPTNEKDIDSSYEGIIYEDPEKPSLAENGEAVNFVMKLFKLDDKKKAAAVVVFTIVIIFIAAFAISPLKIKSGLTGEQQEQILRREKIVHDNMKSLGRY